MRVAVIGLGNMGSPTAVNIARAGHELTVFNRSAGKSEEVRAAGARVAASPAEAARDAEALITVLSDDRAVEEVVLGSGGALEALPRGGVHVGMSTISVGLAARLASAHRQAGQGYVSAPVFGRPEAAAAGKLWVVAAGPHDAIERCRPLLEAVGQGVFELGEDPAGANAVKLGGNFLLAAAIEALAEALVLTRRHGVAAERFLAIVASSLFRSPIYESYGRLIAEERFSPAGFALRLGLKDLRLALAAGDAAGVPMPLASLLRDRLLAAANRGMGELDWSALGRLAADDAGPAATAGSTTSR